MVRANLGSPSMLNFQAFLLLLDSCACWSIFATIVNIVKAYWCTYTSSMCPVKALSVKEQG